MGRTRVYGFAVVCAAFGWAGCTIEDSGNGDPGAAGDNGSDAGESSGASGGNSNAPGGRAGSSGSGAVAGKQATADGGVGGEATPLGGAAGDGTSPISSPGGGGNATDGGAGAVGGDAAGAGGAPVDPTAPGPLTVHVRNRNDEPIAGTLVAFYEPNLQDVTVVRADLDGNVTHDVKPGSAVTVGISLTGNPTTTRQLVTFLGTKPGDDLVARDQGYPYQPLSGHYYVQYNPIAGDAPAWYYAHVACKDWGAGYASQAGVVAIPINIYMDPSCVDEDGNLTFFAASYDNQGNMIGVVPPQTLPFTDGGQTFLGPWQTAKALKVSTIIPAPASGGFISTQYRVGARTLYQNTAYLYGNTPQSYTFQVPPSGLDSIVVGIEEKFDDSGGMTPIVGRRTVEAPIGEISRPPKDMLPRLSNPSGGTTAQGLPQISWASEASLAGVDGGIIAVHANVAHEGQNNAVTYDDITWTIVVPPGTVGPVSPPPLVGELAPFAGKESTPFEVKGISFIKSTAIHSYDTFRHEVGRSFMGPREYPRGPDGDFVTERTWLEAPP